MSSRRTTTWTEQISPQIAQPELRECILGLDWGTTSTRAVLLDKQSGRLHHLENSKGRLHRELRWNKEEFPSAIYPFDDAAPLWYAIKGAPDRQSASSKIIFNSCVADPDGENPHAEGYSLVEQYSEFRDDDATKTRVLAGITVLFTAIRYDIERQVPGAIISTIAATIPGQWTGEHERLYRAILNEAWEEQCRRIVFVAEAEGLAHYLFRDHIMTLVPPPCPARGNVVLVLDFGGHNMNGCIIDVAFHPSDTGASFFEYQTPEAAGGGSEEWEYLMAKECHQLLISRGHINVDSELKPKQRQDILDQINQGKSYIGPSNDKEFDWKFTTSDESNINLCLSPKQVEDCFREALRHALNKAESMIEMAATISQRRARVVVTGGTAQHDGVRTQIRHFCRSHNLTLEPKFGVEFGGAYVNMKLAQGATYAVQDQITPGQFIFRGAAIGLQCRQEGFGSKGGDHLWDDVAILLFKEGDPVETGPVEIKANGRSAFKLICDPFFDANATTLRYENCYDFLELGVLRGGIWSWAIQAIVNGDGDVKLVLEWKRRYPPPSSRVERGREVFDLYFRAASNTAHLGSPDKSPEHLFQPFWNKIRRPNHTNSDMPSHQLTYRDKIRRAGERSRSPPRRRSNRSLAGAAVARMEPFGQRYTPDIL